MWWKIPNTIPESKIQLAGSNLIVLFCMTLIFLYFFLVVPNSSKNTPGGDVSVRELSDCSLKKKVWGNIHTERIGPRALLLGDLQIGSVEWILSGISRTKIWTHRRVFAIWNFNNPLGVRNSLSHCWQGKPGLSTEELGQFACLWLLRVRFCKVVVAKNENLRVKSAIAEKILEPTSFTSSLLKLF